MLRFKFSKPQDKPYKVLCLGAHSDDIEIGCGGTVLRLLENNSNIFFYWTVFSDDEQREEEAMKSAAVFLHQAKNKQITVKNFRNSFFPYIGGEIKEYFEILKQELCPDLIFTHHRNDRHQDHRLINELTWNTFRNHFILEYEVPKYDGDLGAPNFFVSIDDHILKRKNEIILNAFISQKEKHWFDAETFTALPRIRGMESNTKYAEAFYAQKVFF